MKELEDETVWRMGGRPLLSVIVSVIVAVQVKHCGEKLMHGFRKP